MGEPYCTDCPDREACMTGYSCEHVRRIAKQLAKQGESNAPRTFASDLTRVSSLAREVSRRMEAHLSGLEVLLSRHADRAMVLNGRTLMLPQHSAEGEAAMSAELVACTLGARDRPELVPAPPFSEVRGVGIEPTTGRV